jgi:diaminopimelate epimerase
VHFLESFRKYHGLGNDYVVIDPNKTTIRMTGANIKKICDYNYGLGSDGILYGPITRNGKVGVVIYNPDGSEAEKSGNGVRIFSKYLRDIGYIKEKEFVLSTLGGDVHVKYLDEKGTRIQVNMGIPSFCSKDIPVRGKDRLVIDEPMQIGKKEYRVTCLSIGNPHCVIPVQSATRELALEIGPLVERHTNFPNRINMQLLQIIDKNNIKIEIWERGAEYTLASGSSSCAAACAAYKLGLVNNQINVNMPGGVIQIEIQTNGSVIMTGAVSSIAVGMFTDEFLNELEK